ncbi:MAG: hypothetical protein ACP5R5_02200 [Armatimonadota bacterium]
MGLSWMDELWAERLDTPDDPLGAFYCPYTNAPICPVVAKGWRPQQLCRDLDCEQLRFVDPKRRRHRHTS